MIIIILIIIIILLLLRSCSTEAKSGGNKNNYATSGEIVPGEIEFMSQEEIQQKVNETVVKGMFQVFMNTKITVDKDGVMDLKIQNNKNNHYDCFVTIYKGNDQIYKSDVIKPGYKLETDTLTYELEAGTHDCLAYFCVLNEAGEEINQIGLEIKVINE